MTAEASENEVALIVGGGPGVSSSCARRFAMLCLLLASSLGCDAVVGRMVETAAERQRNAGHTEWLDDGALHVVLCGTGSPLPDPTSAAACTASWRAVASGWSTWGRARRRWRS